MNKRAYQELIDENIAWLEKQEKTLERDHIISIVKNSVSLLYPSNTTNKPISINEGTCDDCYSARDGKCRNSKSEYLGKPFLKNDACAHWSERN